MNIQTVIHRLAGLLAAVLLPPLVLLGQAPPDLPYDSGSTGADGPLTFRSFLSPGRYQHAMAFDGQRQQIVIFGGLNSGNPLGDTWSWDGAKWASRTSPQNPPPRYDHAMAYDSAHKLIVLYGGQVAGVGPSADTWTWNGTNWTQMLPSQSPPRLYAHAMTYDAARKQVVLFGGLSPDRGGNWINETWLWDGTNWAQAAPSSQPGPHGYSTLTYDSQHQNSVLFGSVNLNNTQYDTWLWDGTNWSQASPQSRPSGRQQAAAAFDDQRQAVILFGGIVWEGGNSASADTWQWDGTNWTALSLTASPSGRYGHAMAYDSTRKTTVLVGGYSNSAESWQLAANSWTLWSADYATFDMTAKANGIWNYTTIDVPAGLAVYFQKNAANTPVQWLASGNVTVNGVLYLNGSAGSNNPNPGNEAPGGPGGFAGGLGAIRFDQSSTYTGAPGQGPGGGAPGVGAADGSNGGQRYGQPGTYDPTYGNAYIQPLIGGSGGGGGGSGYSDSGGDGGGGGGAILIASSRDIVVNGGIYANGGAGGNYAGAGSGGAIRLVADRVSGGGIIQAVGGGQGRIRVEGFYRSLVGNGSPGPSVSAPIATRNFNGASALIISKVAGLNVAQPPSGISTNPDVVFTAAGDITVEVRGTSIPDTTPVTLRVTTPTGVIIKPAQSDPPVTLANGVATFTLTVPAGLGTVQAFAQVTQQ